LGEDLVGNVDPGAKINLKVNNASIINIVSMYYCIIDYILIENF